MLDILQALTTDLQANRPVALATIAQVQGARLPTRPSPPTAA